MPRSKPTFIKESTYPMSIRFAVDERTRIEKAAIRDGMKFGSWVREIAVLAADRGMRVSRKTEIKRVYKPKGA